MRLSAKRVRLSRQATAYARLAAKADRAGDYLLAASYRKTESRIRQMAQREKNKRSYTCE